jgi:3-deoxy-7-phosphoheptulonate synthase
VIRTKGNAHGHVVLRGGGGKPNYDSVNIALCEQELRGGNIVENIMVDCSHENSNKNHELQPLVLDNITHQIIDGNQSIIGVMIESNIGAGNQKINEDRSKMQYGVSITDKCIDWETTENTLLDMHEKLKGILATR